MKVLLIELDYHPEVVQGICSHLKDSSFELGLVTRKRIYNQIKGDQLPEKIYILEGTESIPAFFNRNKILDSSWDLIVFTTAQTNFKSLNKLSFQTPIAVIVHNIHAYFDRSKIKIRWNPFFLWKDFSFILRIILLNSDWYFRKKFLDRVDHFLFPSNFMLEYARRHYPNQSHRFSKNIISWVSTKKVNRSKKDFFSITVIGTIDRRRRDYNQVIQLIQFLKSRVSKKVKITLAGQPYGSYGKQVVKEVESLASDNIMVSTFSTYVPDEELIRIAEETDLFLAPIVSETRHHIWTEYYGKTKISGNVNNAIEYGKPTLIPDFYPIESDLSDLLIPYQGMDDLKEQVLNFLENGVNDLAEDFTQKVISESLYTALDECVTKQ